MSMLIIVEPCMREMAQTKKKKLMRMKNVIRWVFQHTDVGYQQEAKASKISPRIVDLPHGARGNWIGDPNAEHVLVWYHGLHVSIIVLEH